MFVKVDLMETTHKKLSFFSNWRNLKTKFSIDQIWNSLKKIKKTSSHEIKKQPTENMQCPISVDWKVGILWL